MGTDGLDGDLGGILRDRLEVALRARDLVAVSALRSALAAIGNAEAVPPERVPRSGPVGGPIAGALDGLGAGEVARRSLSGAEVAEIVQAEITERRVAATGYQRSGHRSRAERLIREVDVLEAALSAVSDRSAPA